MRDEQDLRLIAAPTIEAATTSTIIAAATAVIARAMIISGAGVVVMGVMVIVDEVVGAYLAIALLKAIVDAVSIGVDGDTA